MSQRGGSRLRRWAVGGLMVGLMLVGVEIGQAPRAEAAGCPGPPISFGRGDFCGYFDNNQDLFGGNVLTGNPAIPNSVGDGAGNDTQEFINLIVARLRGGSAQDKVGARFLILTMLGYPAGTPRGTVTGSAAPGGDPVLDRWVQTVRFASSQGRIAWKASAGFPCGIVNTYFQNLSTDDGFFLETPAAGDGCGPVATKLSIVFFNPDGSRYTIKRDCANPIGDLTAVASTQYTINLNIVAVNLTNPGPVNTAQPGDLVRLDTQVRNAGPTDSDEFALETANTTTIGPGATQWNAPPHAPSLYPVNSTSPTRYTGYGTGCNPAFPQYNTTLCGGFHWRWMYDDGWPRGPVSTQSFFVTIPAAAVNGNRYCYSAQARAGDQTGANSALDTVCITVVQPKDPSVVAQNGDVHAGGGLCKQPQQPASAGFVRGNAAAGSYADYVVSASAAGGISGLKSQGTAAADNLRLGQNGAYAEVCRPDLMNAPKGAEDYYAAGVGMATITGNVDIASLNPAYDVFFANGNISLHGTVSRKLTIVARNNYSVRINGNITLANTNFAPRDVPSLGIIAGGDITIDAAVTRLDAYLFANGDIDTCVGTTAACSSVLTVNGFLMAKSIGFHRLASAAVFGPQVAEQIVLNPQIYLNPPKLFDASIDDVSLEGQGERPPLF